MDLEKELEEELRALVAKRITLKKTYQDKIAKVQDKGALAMQTNEYTNVIIRNLIAENKDLKSKLVEHTNTNIELKVVRTLLKNRQTELDDVRKEMQLLQEKCIKLEVRVAIFEEKQSELLNAKNRKAVRGRIKRLKLKHKEITGITLTLTLNPS